ncbi:MAG: virulence RhuM family protein [bacterium]
MKEKNIKPVDFLIYNSPNGEVKVDVLLENENIWMQQKNIASLFDVKIPAISKHINNIYKEGELNKESTISILETVQNEGDRLIKRKVEYYNLDLIIAVGYRVNSKKATQFRIWASSILKEYLIKGYSMNVERLKNPVYVFGKDYFEEQLAIIKDIRSSERRLYQKITDIYAKCSIDYELDSDTTRKFFSFVQNKLHYSVTKQTASEVIMSRADSTKRNMGLTNWKNSPKGMIRISDVAIAKNYLNKEELKSLNNIVSIYLDYAEMQAQKNIPMTMNDWVDKLNGFLKFTEKEILNDSGKVTNELAKGFAENEFVKYQKVQDKLYESDFDRDMKVNLEKLENNTKEL